MEEKGTVKISLAGFFLILAIIAIVVMGFFMYKFYTDKQKANEKVETLNSEVSRLQSTINSIQSTINNNSNASPNDSNTTMTEVEAKKLVEEKLNLALKLTELDGGFETQYNKDNNTYPVVNYQEICDKYMTESFEKYFRDHIWMPSEWKNGTLYFLPSGYPRHTIKSIKYTDIKIMNNDIMATLNLDFTSIGGGKRNYDCDFEIINENGNWKINKYTLIPNGDWVYDENYDY